MFFLGKLDSVLNSNSKDFSLFFNQSKGNIRARQIADVPRQILFSYELNLTVRRLRRSTMLPVIIVSSCRNKMLINPTTGLAGLGKFNTD